MAVFLSPIGSETFFQPGGNSPANGAKLFTYLSGSSQKQASYTTSSGTVSYSNPIVLDSGGNIGGSGEIWLGQASTYRFVLAPSNDTDPPTSPYWTKDSITGINDFSGAVISAEWVAASTTPVFSNASSFVLSGDQRSIFTVGRRVKTTNSGGTVYGTVTSSVFVSSTTIFVVNDAGNLDSGLSAVSYGILSTPNGSVPYTDITNSGLLFQATTQIASASISGGTVTTGPLTVNSTATFNSSAVFTRPIDLTSSTAGQIAFTSSNPSTSATVLDDYREISWTPSVTFGGASSGMAFASRSGTATKIGNRVIAEYEIVLSSLGTSSGQALLVNLPGPPNGSCLTPSSPIDWINMGTAMVYMVLSAPSPSGTALIRGLSAAGTSLVNVTSGNFANNTDLRGSISYFV